MCLFALTQARLWQQIHEGKMVIMKEWRGLSMGSSYKTVIKNCV